MSVFPLKRASQRIPCHEIVTRTSHRRRETCPRRGDNPGAKGRSSDKGDDMNKSIAILPFVALVAACGGNDSGGGGTAGSQLKIVG